MAHDIVVIGGGVGGCGVAALMAKKGLKVLLVEKNSLIGGRCSSYEKDGFILPTYIHAFARVDKGPCGWLANAIGEPLHWGREKVAVFNLKGKEIHAPIGRDISLTNLKAAKAMKLPPQEFLRIGRLAFDAFRKRKRWDEEFDQMDVRTWLSRHTDNETIHSMLALITTASFVVPYWECSIGEFLHILMDMQEAGYAGYPMEECGAIAQAYLNSLLKSGGEYRQEKVEKINVKGNKVQEVVLGNGEVVKAKAVISNIGVKATVTDLVGSKSFDKEYVARIEGFKHSWSAVVVKIAVDKKITEQKAGMYMPTLDAMSYFQQVERGEVPDELALWVTIPSNLSPSLAPPDKQLICAGTPMPYRKDVDWSTWVDNCVKTMERLFPDIRKHFMWQDVVTPADIDKYGGKDGTVIGIAQSTDQVGKNRPSIESPIDGLYFVGSDVGSRAIGVELAAESALRCAEIVDKQFR